MCPGELGGVERDVQLVPPELLHVDAQCSATEAIISLEGDFDIDGTQAFGACVAAVLEKHPKSIAIDAHGLTYTDSSGLRSLLLARESAQVAGAAFRIDTPSPELRHLIERTGLLALLLNE